MRRRFDSSPRATIAALVAAFIAVVMFSTIASAQPVRGTRGAAPPPSDGTARPSAADAPDAPDANSVARGGSGVTVTDLHATTSARWSAHSDNVDSHGPGMAILFWMFAAATIAGALFVVSRRNLITAVMGMVGSFFGIAALYMLLYAHFLAVVQLLVYAGAIMVLFVFVIMILNRPEDEPVAPSGRAGQVVGGIAIVYLVGRLIMILMNVQSGPGSNLAPPPVPAPGLAGGVHYDWGSVKAVGMELFSNGLFPFEAISLLLLIAVVGAIAIARPLHEDAEDHDPNAARHPYDPDAVTAAQAGHPGRSS